MPSGGGVQVDPITGQTVAVNQSGDQVVLDPNTGQPLQQQQVRGSVIHS